MRTHQSGFTLIELLVVCAIIGVLAALAIPNYFYAKSNALNASAASDMRNILPAADLASTKTTTDYTVLILPGGGEIDPTGLPGARSTAGVLGTVDIGPNTYRVEAYHQNGTICYSYDTVGAPSYHAQGLPGDCT